MKVQTLHKRLSLPLLLTVISATGIGVSSPAHSTSLIGSQSKAIDANPEATLIAGGRCPYGMKPEFPPPCHSGMPNKAPESLDSEEFPSDIPTKDPRYERKLEQQRQQQQRELEQQQRELEQQQRELEQQPTVEPAPQN